MDVLNYMRLFVEVAKRKSFRGAAEALGMPNSTLSRNIAELEKTIGLRLLHRSTRKVELTDAGEVYFKRCQNIVEEALYAHEALRDFTERPIGTLRVSMTSDFAVGYLAPILRDFASAYPLIKFDFDVTARRVDLQADPIDLAIRMGAAPTSPSTLVARQVALLPRYLFASPVYLKQAPRLSHANDLANHVLCVGQAASRQTDVWRRLQRGDEVVAVMGGSRFVSNSAALTLAMAANGLGIAGLDPQLARDHVAAGRLHRVLPDWDLEPTQVHVITDTRHLPARSKLFIAFLKVRLGELGSESANGPS
jgi:DNA-binding transcriptional LysR family regulator